MPRPASSARRKADPVADILREFDQDPDEWDDEVVEPDRAHVLMRSILERLKGCCGDKRTLLGKHVGILRLAARLVVLKCEGTILSDDEHVDAIAEDLPEDVDVHTLLKLEAKVLCALDWNVYESTHLIFLPTDSTTDSTTDCTA